jgi:predicted dienelactone hydrolase
MRSKFSSLTLLCLVFTMSTTASAQDNRIDMIRSDAPSLAAYSNLDIGVKTFVFKHEKQVDVLNIQEGQPAPLYDRPLTTEVWYPATIDPNAKGLGEYSVFFRDGKTQITLHGRAMRDAKPNPAKGPYPLIIMAHGYPGNRFLMSPIAENLASKGYVVASIDFTDSTYSDQANFASTLRNRPLDISFVIDRMVAQNTDTNSPLKGLMDTQRIGLIGYSMGGYGVINKIGGGFSDNALKFPKLPKDILNPLLNSNPEFAKLRDPRIKAAVTFAPWGWNQGFWDAKGLQNISTPWLMIGGSIDDVAGYAPGMRNIFEASVNADRYLLTFENANHNAGAPMPAPKEAWKAVPWLPNIPAAHYIDPVWDNVRMNNVSEHFITAFLGKYIRNDSEQASYLDLVEYAKDGKWSANADSSFKGDHTYWKGFPARTAVGLRFEHLGPAKP